MTDTQKDYLVIYDISSDIQRKKLAAYLDGYGSRIQKSAYEMHLSETKVKKLMKGMPRFCKKGDNIRLYEIPDKSDIMNWGDERSTNSDDVVIV